MTAGNRERCARRGRSGFWSNFDCATKYSYICQSDTTYPGSFTLRITETPGLKFLAAKKACGDSGMRLVDIKTSALNSLILQKVSGLTGAYWTGGTNIGHTNIYKWGDETVVRDDDPGWNKPTEPNNKHQNNFCIAVLTTKSGWADVSCGGGKGYICQKDVVEGSCAKNICLNQGTCEISKTRYKCSCAAGYFGTKCEKAESFKISTERENYTTVQGHNVTVKLHVTSDDVLVQIEVLNTSATYKNVTGPINITIGPLLRQTEGDMYVLAATHESRNGFYYEHAKITIRVEGPPSVEVSPNALALPVEKSETSVQCETRGVPRPSATWVKDGMEINTSTMSDVYQIRFGDSSRLYFSQHARRDVGNYTCIAQNIVAGQAATATASLFVRGKPLVVDKRSYPLASSTGRASFACSFEGYPKSAIDWIWNNGTHDKLIQKNNYGAIFQLETREETLIFTQSMSTLSVKVPEYLGNAVISCCSSNGDESSCESFTRQNTVLMSSKNRTYRIYGNGNRRNYSEAQKLCKTNNGNLTQISDIRTQETLSAALTTLGLGGSVFTGGQKFMVRNYSIWRWGDGSFLYNESRRGNPVTGVYTAWGIGEPNEPENKCLALSETTGWNWTDTKCSEVKGFICESTVAGIPDQFLVNIEKCSSNIAITWVAGLGAIGVEHSIEIVDHRSKTIQERFVIIPSDQKPIQRLSHMELDSNYNVTITVCPDCPYPYSITKDVTTYAIIPAFNVTVNEANLTRQDERCLITWLASSKGIIGFKIVAFSTLSRVASSEYLNLNFIDEHVALEKESEHVLIAEPNRVYNFTIQAQTCTGFGPPVRARGYCVTEVAAPSALHTPTVITEMNGHGTIPIDVMIPSETRGPVSCMFIVVTYMPDPTKNESIKYDLDQLQTASDEGTSGIFRPSDSYLAIAIKRTEISDDLENIGHIRRVLGDGIQTHCNIGTDSNETRRKRSTTPMQITGTNRKLESGISYSAFTVTTTASHDQIFFQTSKVSRFEKTPPPTTGGNIAGVVIGIVLLIALVLAAFFYLKKRRYFEKQCSWPMSMQVVQNNEESLYANLQTENWQPISETDIPLDKLHETYKMLQQNGCAKFHEQFQKLKAEAKELKYSTEVASDPKVKMKNRYKNILPSDTSRVVLSGNGEGSYINASYVDGFRNPKKFIAAQGPLKNTVNDFWKMVFEHKSTVVVMLTKCQEKSKTKCEKYWPDVGRVQTFGDIVVKNSQEKIHGSYTVRSIEISNAGMVERVKQLHFLDWPDHGVPVSTTNIMNFCSAVDKLKTDRPVIVHCSAGAGRTGAFIAYDILSEKQESLRSIDVYGCVLKMREQRVDMVQTCDQYILLHKLLLEKHLFGKTETDADRFSEAHLQAKLHSAKNLTICLLLAR